ncbi:UDP-N-acetylmuramoyl-tripeptide--D-alanyl-D-alanine ligase [Guyparkeria hydrothermalis]|uniref:UDP-N-acetylmuramoyl-tripeptide--D-alanyl-D- alanine ligase n=1 Tax=Guyparkeria hydrothermalis TaxID=923 RepID=UPI0020220E11|nr:UDP-N-acetylmuramoyl-tripeptide--D-alanyl-D-alanine ligase [Guyparkeria hydrothermalis]MCL7744515.1 UDP-N-acetylmuramoyl-tripeptide--D-alanyl-D-alanine ligase [Guyparkeria hydrothermalis]
MIRATLEQIASWSGGRLAAGVDPATLIAGAGTDTRADLSGRLFVALKGPNFDAHAFLAQAVEQGAVAALVEQEQDDVSLPQVVVDDTQAALGRLARGWREAVDPTVIAITGSSGKTTVKELLAAMLGEVGPTAATRGNLNNEIGVPLTLLDWPAETRFAVVEMGANHVGEIAALTELVAPDIVMVTMAGRAHVGEFGSVERIIEAKGEIYRHRPETARPLINLDSAGADQWLKSAPKADTFTLDASHREWATWTGHYDAAQHELSIDERGRPALDRLPVPIPGAHNAMNLLAAIAVARLAGASFDAVTAGLAAFRPPAGRMDVIRLANGWRVIDDSYNANPESMRAALGYLAGQPGERFAVLGSMGELGAQAETLHRQLGEFAAGEELDGLIAVGPWAAAIATGFRAAAGSPDSIDTAEDSTEAAKALHARLATRSESAVTVLLKGSRFMHIERVREDLEREYGVAPKPGNESTGRGRDAALAD